MVEALDNPVVTSSHQYEAAYLNCPVDKVWDLLRGLDLQICFPDWIREVNMIQGEPGKVGSQFQVTYRDDAKWTFQILEVSDIKRTIIYELVNAEPASTMSGYESTFRVFHETLDNKAFLVWETQFSNDASAKVVMDTKFKKVDALNSLKRVLQCS